MQIQMQKKPLITVAVPSLNQGKYLNQTLRSIFDSSLPVEVFVLDGGSSDCSLDIIQHWDKQIAGWRSHPDHGQSAAINEGIAQGSAPFVAWLNSDDYYAAGGLAKLLDTIRSFKLAPAVYGKTMNYIEPRGLHRPAWVQPFSTYALARRCIISQPATLIRRDAWEAVGGLNQTLKMAFDYDLWWRLYKYGGPLAFCNELIAFNRDHRNTKTNMFRHLHYSEAIEVVKFHYGKVPWKWRLYRPVSVELKTVLNYMRGFLINGN